MMTADWNTRNYSNLVMRGLRYRLKRAKFGSQIVFILGAMWDATNLPMRRPS